MLTEQDFVKAYIDKYRANPQTLRILEIYHLANGAAMAFATRHGKFYGCFFLNIALEWLTLPDTTEIGARKTVERLVRIIGATKA